MKPKFKTVLFNNGHVIGYHTNSTAAVSSFATNEYVYSDKDLKDILWASDQYLSHAFHIAADNKCSFYGHFIGLKGDEIVLYLKLQSIGPFGSTQNKSAIKHFKISCNMDAHLVTVMHPLVTTSHTSIHP